MVRFSMIFATLKRSQRKTAEVGFVPFLPMFCTLQRFRATCRNRSHVAPGAFRNRIPARNALRKRPLTVQAAPGGSLDGPRDGLGPTLAGPGRLKSALGASRARSGSLLDASPGVPDASPGVPERSNMDFRRFFADLSSIFRWFARALEAL